MYSCRFILPQLDSVPPMAPRSWAEHQHHQLQEAWLATKNRLNKSVDKMITDQHGPQVFTPMQGKCVFLYFPCIALDANGLPKLQQQW